MKRLWFMRDPYFLLAWRGRKTYFKLKRTRDELFSERNNYVKARRFAGWSFITFPVKETEK